LSMINHTRTGRPFSHTLRVEPLRDSQGRVQCFQATSSMIDESIANNPERLAQAREAQGTLSEPRGPASPAPSHFSTSELLEFGDKASGGSHGADRSMSRTASELQVVPDAQTELAGLKKSSSYLQISEMLDLFDQHGASPRATPVQTPPEDAPPPGSLPPAAIAGSSVPPPMPAVPEEGEGDGNDQNRAESVGASPFDSPELCPTTAEGAAAAMLT